MEQALGAPAEVTALLAGGAHAASINVVGDPLSGAASAHDTGGPLTFLPGRISIAFYWRYKIDKTRQQGMSRPLDTLSES
jgi:hypothetical protein